MFSTAYVTSHKANCRAGAFSMDGSLCATGSVDASIKILDVDRMLAKSQIESMASGNKPVDPGSHPVIRTLYDHVEVRIKKLNFHNLRQHFSKIFYYQKLFRKSLV